MQQHLIITGILSLLSVLSIEAQTTWTMQRCMQYAVAHNHEVRKSELELDSYQASKTGAIGRFLPAVDAGIGVQYNFGRAIDPETNTYTDVSTFYNGYSLQTTLPLFDGFSRLHALKAAKASVLMGRHALRNQQDEVALRVLQAYTNAVYYKGMIRMAEEKQREAELLLRQTRVLEEVGRKSAADVALVESQQAEAIYELTRQQNLLTSALLELKKEMAFPLSEELSVKSEEFHDRQAAGETLFPTADSHSCDSSLFTLHSSLFTLHSSLNPLHSSLETARYKVMSAKHEWHQARSNLFPTLSLSAGLNTTYYHTLHSSSASGFGQQLKNNMGEYVGISLSIPIFNRLQTVTSIRRAKNNYLMARESFEEKRQELEKNGREAWQDWQGYLLQIKQMEKKVEADSIAHQLTRRQYEEGLSTAIDVHTTSAQLLNSKATLLQCRLMAVVKEYLIRYYHGDTIWQ